MLNKIASVTVAILLLASKPAAAGSPFEGKWEGPWTSQQGITGTFSLMIGPDGEFSGTTAYADNKGTISGHIDAAGNLDARYKYSVVTYRAKAKLALAGDHLRGTAAYSLPVGPQFDSGSIDLSRR